MPDKIFSKRVDRNTFFNPSSNKRRKHFYGGLENKENYWSTNFNNAAQYFYADPSFFIHDTNYKCNRAEGGYDEREVYYDCLSCESEQAEQLEIFEVIREIQDPKEFRRLLKCLAYTSNAVYQTFRQAYKGTKKRKQKTAQNVCVNKNYTCEISSDHLGRGDMNPSEISQILNPTEPQNTEEFVEDGPNCSEKRKEKRKKTPRNYDKCLEEQKSASNKCKTCPMCNGEIWASCMDGDVVKDCERSGQISLKPGNTDRLNETKCVEIPCCAKGAKNVFHLDPVCVTIPLKLQIDSQNCRSRFIETEILIDSFGGAQGKQQNRIQETNLHIVPVPKSPADRSQINKSGEPQEVIGGEEFTSCISYSGIKLAPVQCLPPEKNMVSTGTAHNAPTTKTNFAQTVETSPQVDQKLIALQLRTALLAEVRAALEQTTPTLALKALLEGKRFSLSTKQHLDETTATNNLPNTSTSPAHTLAPLPLSTSSPTKDKILETPAPIVAQKLERYDSALNLSEYLQPDEIRYEIEEDLRELLAPDHSKPKIKYAPEERDEVLLDLLKLFHPKNAEALPKQNALQDISYLLEREVNKPGSATSQAPKASESQDSILESIRYILNPQPTQNIEKEKYSKDTTDKVLRDFIILLTPRTKRVAKTQGIRDNILQDLRCMLDTGPESKSAGSRPTTELAMRHEIQENLKELLAQDHSKDPEKDDILLDLHTIFHPDQAGTLSKQICCENALQDIRYLLEPEVNTTESSTTKPSESQASLLQSIRHILNPNSSQNPKIRKYSKDTTDKILKDFVIILKLPKERESKSQKMRDSVMYDLRHLLYTGVEGPPIPTDIAGPSRALEVSQERAHNEIRDCIIRDIRYLLDSTDTSMPKSNIVVANVATTGQAPDSAIIKSSVPQKTHQLGATERFSLPTYTIPKEIPARSSLPSNYKAKAETSQAAQFVAQDIQTDLSAVSPTGHYKRSEIRNEIQENLKELLAQEHTKHRTTYKPEEKDDILLDLHKLFHPKKTGTLPKRISCENALEDIRYLLETEINKPVSSTTKSPQVSESQDSILQSIKYILNPKSTQKPKKKKYSKEAKEQILEDLRILLTPSKQRTPKSQEIRDSVLHDLQNMLHTGVETTSAENPSRSTDIAPGSSRAQVRRQKPHSEVRDSLLNDIRFLLDTTNQPQSSNSYTLEQNLARTRQLANSGMTKPSVLPKPNKSDLKDRSSLPTNLRSNEMLHITPARNTLPSSNSSNKAVLTKEALLRNMPPTRPTSRSATNAPSVSPKYYKPGNTTSSGNSLHDSNNKLDLKDRYSLPTNLKSNETPDKRPVRNTLPSNQKAAPTKESLWRISPSTQLASRSATNKNNVSEKPNKSGTTISSENSFADNEKKNRKD